MRLFDTDGADAAYDRWQDPPEQRMEINEALRDECRELDAQNREESRSAQFLNLKESLEENMAEWNLEFKVVDDGIDIMEGERRVAKIFDPVDAQRLMKILKTQHYMAKIAAESIKIISDLQRYAFGEKDESTVKFVTEANYMLGVLKEQSNVNASSQKTLDGSESKV